MVLAFLHRFVIQKLCASNFFLAKDKEFLVAVIKIFQLASYEELAQPRSVKMKRSLNKFRHEVALGFRGSCLGGLGS